MKKAISSLQLPFSNKTFRRNSVFVNALPREEFVVRLLCCTLMLLIFAYVTLVSLTIVHVIARKEAGDRSNVLRAVVGSLEQDYFALSHGVGERDGVSIGLAPVSNTEYVYRPGSVGSSNAVRNEINEINEI